MEEWCFYNNQELNIDKSRLLLSMRSPLEIELSSLPIVSTLKVLGVQLNASLTWDDHIAVLYKKACQRLHLLRTLKPYIHKDELREVYISVIRSIFDYCCPAFVRIPGKLSKQIRSIEVRAHRLI